MCRYTDIRDPSSEQCRALCHVLKQRWLWVMKGGALLPYNDLLIQGGAGPFQCRIPAVFPKANARAQSHGGVPALSVWAGFSSPSFVSSVESTTLSKHWLSLEFAALWKLLIAQLLGCLVVSLLRFLCVLFISIPFLPCVPRFVFVLEWCFSPAFNRHGSVWFFQEVLWGTTECFPSETSSLLVISHTTMAFFSFDLISRHAINGLRIYQAKPVYICE